MRTPFLKTSISLFLCSLFYVSNLNAQSLVEQFGGVKTDFRIVAGDNILDIQDQSLHRTIHSLNTNNDCNRFADTFQLEFMTDHRLNFKQRWGYKYMLEFYDENDRLLSYIDLNESNRSTFRGRYSFTYIFNLQQTPLLILDSTATIRISLINR